MRTLSAILLLITIFTTTGQGSEQDVDCQDPATQSQMNHCAFIAYQQADKELNAIWKQVYASVKETDQYSPPELRGGPDALLNAQRAWIKFRDLHCESTTFEYAGGSIVPLIFNSCLEALTHERIKQLREFLLEG